VLISLPSWRGYEMPPRRVAAVLCSSAGGGDREDSDAHPVAGQAGEAGVPVLAGRAVVDEGAPPFWPWRRVLEQGQDHGLSATLLEMPDALPAAARFLAIERTVQALLAAARPAGLVVILDDLQWADDASLRLLRYLRGDLTGSRLLVVGAAREVTEALAGLQPLVLRLPPLTESDVAAYLTSVGEVGGAWPAYVHARTGVTRCLSGS